MHQRVHSAVLDKEHRIYNFMYIWFLKENSDINQKSEKYVKHKLSFFFLFSPTRPL